MGVLLIAASFLSGSTKVLTIAAAQAAVSDTAGGDHTERGASCD
jgi:hypothetical protein